MAAGENWFNCTDKNISLEQAIRLMAKDDGNGNPVFTTNPDTVLEPYINCEQRRALSTEMLLRTMIIEDADGNPIWNISTE